MNSLPDWAIEIADLRAEVERMTRMADSRMEEIGRVVTERDAAEAEVARLRADLAAKSEELRRYVGPAVGDEPVCERDALLAQHEEVRAEAARLRTQSAEDARWMQAAMGAIKGLEARGPAFTGHPLVDVLSTLRADLAEARKELEHAAHSSLDWNAEVERLTRLLDVTRENARLLASSSGERERGRDEGLEDAAVYVHGCEESNLDYIAAGIRALRSSSAPSPEPRRDPPGMTATGEAKCWDCGARVEAHNGRWVCRCGREWTGEGTMKTGDRTAACACGHGAGSHDLCRGTCRAQPIPGTRCPCKAFVAAPTPKEDAPAPPSPVGSACEACGGSGYTAAVDWIDPGICVPSGEPCDACHGTGRATTGGGSK